MHCRFPGKLATIVVVWTAACAVDTAWSRGVPADVDPAVAVRQLHSNEAVEELQRDVQTSGVKAAYAVAAIVTTGICLDSAITRLSGRNHDQSRLERGSAEVEERQER